jgi:hypothetical protein
MKLILENWNSFLNEAEQTVMYHSTPEENVEAILVDGLKVGADQSVHTGQHAQWADRKYGTRPIFLSAESGRYEGVPLKVDVTGLVLVADLASVSDLGSEPPSMSASFKDGLVLKWSRGTEPEELAGVLDDRGIAIKKMLDPNSEEAKAAIAATGTAAVLEDIPAERISR